MVNDRDREQGEDQTISRDLIAPCGMNCALCMAHLRDKNICPGCRSYDESKPTYCRQCIVTFCENLNEEGFCFGCEKLPCKRIKQLDKRYTAKYGMSMIGNLAHIEEHGIDAFIEKESERWRCTKCGSLFSVHRDICLKCGNIKPDHLKQPEG